MRVLVFFSSFTNQIDQIARPGAAAARGGVPAGPYALQRRRPPLGTFVPRAADTRRVCLLGYRVSSGKHFRFYSRTYDTHTHIRIYLYIS